MLFGARLFSIKQKQQKMYQYNREYEILQDFYQEHEENVYFIAEWFVSGYSDIFHLQRKNSKANGFEMGGWLALSPIYEEELRQNGIECLSLIHISPDPAANPYTSLPGSGSGSV